MKKYLLITVLIFGWISLSAQTSKIENAGFEKWENVLGISGHPEPVDWSTIKNSDNSSLATLSPVNWAQSDTAHSGKYSVKLFNVSDFDLVATGTLTNGRIHSEWNPDSSYAYTDTASSLWSNPFTDRPDSLVGWFTCQPVSGDHGNVLAILHTGYAQHPPANGDSSTWIAKASFDLPSTAVKTWTRFSVPFKYYSDKNPQYILVVLTSGNGTKAIAGSSAKFDDLNVIYKTTGIATHEQGSLKVFATYNQLHIALINAPQGIYQIRIFDIRGRVQYATSLKSGENETIGFSLPSGIYLVRAQHGNNVLVKKVIIR